MKSIKMKFEYTFMFTGALWKGTRIHSTTGPTREPLGTTLALILNIVTVPVDTVIFIPCIITDFLNSNQI